jgi:hypothetical protein
MEAPSSPLSSRPKPRDLRFYGPSWKCFSTAHKYVILSEAPRRSIAYWAAYGAESKDPGDACGQMLFGAFQPQTTSFSGPLLEMFFDRIVMGLWPPKLMKRLLPATTPHESAILPFVIPSCSL